MGLLRLGQRLWKAWTRMSHAGRGDEAELLIGRWQQWVARRLAKERSERCGTGN